LLRCKAEQNINYYKAAVIKACLIRKARFRKEEKTEEELTVGLNNDTTKKAYVLGRLFAVLEKAQVDASSGTLSTTIKDRYFTSASTRPGSVFPRLLQLSNYHTAKSDYGVVREKEKQEILDKLDVDNEPFPKVMTTEDQGYFVLGYYQQRKDLYAKKEN
ncbi:MAG: type I-C CRISPR-associated protein Cas8c/Csd1, partial [Eubacterium sp.]